MQRGKLRRLAHVEQQRGRIGLAHITEAAITFLSLERGLIPANANRGEIDPALTTEVTTENLWRPVNLAMSNSFGFGGSNCSLVFGRLG